MLSFGMPIFRQRKSVEQIEESEELAPKFDEKGLMPCVTVDVETNQVLMLGYMNAESFTKTIESGYAHYYSRSRKKLWKKRRNEWFFSKNHAYLY